MKKIILFSVLALGVMTLFSSCIFLIPFTYKINLDQQNPADQNATVIFKNSTAKGDFTFKEWNGKSIKDTVYNKRLIKSNDIIKFTVPAGNNSFLFDITFTFDNQYSSRTYYSENIELRYTFEPGKKYVIKGKYKSLALGFKGIEFYVQLYDTTKRSVMLKEWMVGKN